MSRQQPVLPDIVTAVVLGTALGWILLGSAALNPLNNSWMKDDTADYYIGWTYFRHEASWQLPLLWSHDLGYPLGVSTAYWDVIPPLALLFRLLSPILPDQFQYFGLYGLLCCVLQFYFGLKLSRQIAPGRPLAAILGGIFIATAAPLLFRLNIGHFALASHWLILATLLYFHPTRAPASALLPLLALNILAAAINPYIGAMVLLITLGALAARAQAGRRGAAKYAATVLGIVSADLATMALVGFISPADAGSYAGDGYGLYSMNLLAPINPMGFKSLLLPALPLYFNRQFEGYNYLGLGVIILGLSAVLWRPNLLRQALGPPYAPQRIVVMISLVLALSVCVTAGSKLLFYLAIPNPVFNLLAAFRASGRLFWPGYYILLIAILGAAIKAFPPRWGTPLIAAMLALQLADISSLVVSSSHRWASVPPPSPLLAPVWSQLARNNRHLVVLPAWQCSSPAQGWGMTPGGIDGFKTFGFLAAGERMTLNSFYAPRLSAAQIAYFCRDQVRGLRRDGPAPDTAYVFKPGDPLIRLVGGFPGEQCRLADGFGLCAGKTGAR